MTAACAQAVPHKTSTLAVPSTLRRIVLTGFMGTGKSTVGRLLAETLGWTFLDLDAHLESRAGQTIPELFSNQGEGRFRQMEAAALANALRLPQTVLALGGGAPEHITSRLLLEQTPGTHVVFLEAPFSVLYDRCLLQALTQGTPAGQIRPLLANPAQAEARFLARQSAYRRIAHSTVSSAQAGPEQIAAQVAAQITASLPQNRG